MSDTVITYREAYRDGYYADLCKRHAEDSGEARALRDRAGIGALGPVERGARWGMCDVCHDIELRA